MSLPQTQVVVWRDLEPRYAELQARSADSVYAFLLDWSDLLKTVAETGTFLQLATDLDTADQSAQEQLSHFHQVTQPAVTIADAALRRKVLAVPKPNVPAEAIIVLQRMETDERAYREENVSIEAEEADLITEYSRLTGSQLVEYEGQELTVPEVHGRQSGRVDRAFYAADELGCIPNGARKIVALSSHFHLAILLHRIWIELVRALQLWQQSLLEPEQTLHRYRSALALGNSRSVPELFKAAGVKFAFDRATLREMMSFLRGELKR